MSGDVDKIFYHIICNFIIAEVISQLNNSSADKLNINLM